MADLRPGARPFGVSWAHAQDGRYRIAFIQWQPHTVPAAWSTRIEQVLGSQQVID